MHRDSRFDKLPDILSFSVAREARIGALDEKASASAGL
jgi:hypothetical protein